MTTFEWFLLVVVVIGVPLIVAVVVTLWTLEQARKRQRRNRADAGIGVKRKATRLATEAVDSGSAAEAGPAVMPQDEPSKTDATVPINAARSDEG